MQQSSAARRTTATGSARGTRAWRTGVAALSISVAAVALRGQEPPAPARGAAPTTPPAAGQAEPQANEPPPATQLPADFEPPQEVPAVMTLTQELATEAELEQMLTDLNKSNYKGVLRDGVWNNQTQQVVARWAEFMTKLMTLEKLKSKKLMTAGGLKPTMFPQAADKAAAGAGGAAALAGGPAGGHSSSGGQGGPSAGHGGAAGNTAEKPKPTVAKFPDDSVELRPYLHVIREEIVKEVMNAGISQANTNDYLKFRQNLAGVLTGATEKLLDNNFYVRLNAIVLLGQLNETDENPQRKTSERPYVPAAEPLLTVISDREQLEALKVAAARGVRRIMLLGKTRDAQLKNRVALALISEIGKGDTHFWYQMRLADALGALDLETVNATGGPKPLIVDALVKVMVDDQRHYCARSAAAKALGRVPIAQTVDLNLLGYELAHLGHQMAAEYNQSPASVQWKECFLNLYLAFKPLNDEEKQLFTNPGLMTKFDKRAEISGAYKTVLPLAKHVLAQVKPAPIPGASLKTTSDWLQQNTPSTDRIYPEAQPIRPVMAARPAAERNGTFAER